MTKPIDTFDKAIGARIRSMRKVRGISQQALAQELGVSFQQVQKYEKGLNRIHAKALFTLQHVFGVPIDVFFRDIYLRDDKNASQPHYYLLFSYLKFFPSPLQNALYTLIEEIINLQEIKKD